MVETVFTDEDNKNLKVVAEELPKLHLAVEELKETLDALTDSQAERKNYLSTQRAHLVVGGSNEPILLGIPL